MVTPEYELTPGDYSNVKYWTVGFEQGRLLIKAGATPWGSILLVEIILVGFFCFAFRIAHLETAPTVALAFSVPVGLAIAGCVIGPLLKVRKERSKGNILVYEPDHQKLMLPRERLSLMRSQLVEFRILQECKPKKAGRSKALRNLPSAAELQLVYRNPSEKICTILRASGGQMFHDVVTALKKAEIAKIIQAEQQSDGTQWTAQEL